MLYCNFQFHLYNWSTLKSEMYDLFVARNYCKLSAKFLSGTSTVIEKVGLCRIFGFLLEQL